MIAGTLELQMLANLAKLSEDMGKAKGIVGDAVHGIEKILGAIGIGFSVGVLMEKINHVIEGMDRLQTSSEKTGASVENLSKLQFFAGVSGSNIEGVTSALVKLARAESMAENAAAPSSQAMKYLGLQAKDLSGNLKDPAVLFQELALKLADYKDGAGKTALAVALFGKAGADMLPVLKKMAELGDIEAAVTTKQAQQAENYGIEVAKLNRQKEILWNTIVSAIIPSMKTVVELLIDASKRTDSLGSSAKKLAADGSLETWADNVAMGIARIIDVGKTLIGMFSEIMAPIENLFQKAQSGWAMLSVAAGPGSLDMKSAAIRQLHDESVALDAELKKRYANSGFWSAKTNTQTSEALAAGIAARKKAAAMELAYGPGGPESAVGGSGKDANFALGNKNATDKLKAAEVKLFEGALQGLEKQYFNLTHAGQLATIMYETQFGSLKKLTPEHKLELETMAKKIDAYHTLIIVQEQSVEQVKSLAIVTDASREAKLEQSTANRQELSDMAFSLSLINKTAVEQEKLTAVRKLDFDTRKRIDALKKDEDGNLLAGLEVTAEAMRVANDKQTAMVLAGIDARVTAERSWATGSASAFREYIDHATNAAEQSKTLFTNTFKNIEDALVTFVTTGKLDFKSLANSIIADLARIQIRKAMAGAVSDMEGAGGLIGGLGKLLGFGGTSGGSTGDFGAGVVGGVGYASGSDYISRTGLYQLHQGESVQTAHSVNASGPTFNVDMRGASVEAVARLEKLVTSVNGSIERRALNVMSQARLRGAA